MLACEVGHLYIVKRLLAQGADIEIKTQVTY